MEFSPLEFEALIKKKFPDTEICGVVRSLRQKIFLKLKKMSFLAWLPASLDPVKRYFNNMPEKDFLIKKGIHLNALDILAVGRRGESKRERA